MAIFLSNFINSDMNFAVTEDFPVPGGPCKAITVSTSISRKLAKRLGSDFGFSRIFLLSSIKPFTGLRSNN